MLRNTGHHLSNEYDYRTNGWHRLKQIIGGLSVRFSFSFFHALQSHYLHILHDATYQGQKGLHLKHRSRISGVSMKDQL